MKSIWKITLFYCNAVFLYMMDVGTDIIRYKVLLDRWSVSTIQRHVYEISHQSLRNTWVNIMSKHFIISLFYNFHVQMWLCVHLCIFECVCVCACVFTMNVWKTFHSTTLPRCHSRFYKTNKRLYKTFNEY